jgi:DNA repair exonuclease SbcCD nuclease subunit
MKKVLIIGDIHLKPELGYSQYIKNGREEEKQEILNFIIKQSEDCDSIIFGGDQFNQKNPLSETIKEFTEFLERFKNKEIYIIAGNHEIKPNGETAIDYLKTITNKNWHIITDKIDKVGNMTFCPYFNKSILGVKTDLAATKKIIQQFTKNDMLFVHHAVSETTTTTGVETTIFHEPILPKKELEKLFKLVVGFHVHKPQCDGRTIIAGSIANQESGEHGKYIWKIGEKLAVEQIKLPGRQIWKVENATIEELEKIPKNSIVKVILTEKISKEKIEEIRVALERFDASLLLEQYPSERKKLTVTDNILDYSVEKLLEVYALEKKVDLNKLKSAFELIRK